MAPASRIPLRWQMFALSFVALFLELMVIRWVPSVVGLVAYYANLMLLSSFLGLGIGAMAATRPWKLFDWFPVLMAVTIGSLLLCRDVVVGTAGEEARFFAVGPALHNAMVLGWIFAINALLFVPLGQRMGELFGQMPRLSAYAWDIGGSLAGTAAFGWFSLKYFSPVAGLAVVMAVYLGLATRRRWLAAGLFAGLLFVVARSGDPAAIWSPYHHIVVTRVESPQRPESAPPPGLRTMRNPPIYGVKVNRFGYHYDGTLDAARYDAGTPPARFVADLAEQYRLPYRICRGRERVLIVGAGGGTDVEAALASGVKHVDAVEIDPVIVDVSHRFNSGAPYADPRVTVHIGDARSFIKGAAGGYDLVVFGFLDSQALFSSMSNVRLDGYVYTVESLRTAFGRLNERGTLALSFYLGGNWLGPKLFRMVAEATGREPAMYMFGAQMVLLATKDDALRFPGAVDRFHRARFEDPPRLEVSTDDWPYLYLQRKTVPRDYAIAIGGMLVLALAVLRWLRGRQGGGTDWHFGLLGLGFLLLETKSISDATLYFGATWLVTLITVGGVLLMVLAANLVAARLRAFSFWLFVPLFLALALVIAMPREDILGLGLAGRVAWAALAVPLPVFFAGLVFSTTFRDARDPGAAFGANLIGAMIGGFCEYLAMAVGGERLSLLVAAAYLGSLLALFAGRRAGRAA